MTQISAIRQIARWFLHQGYEVSEQNGSFRVNMATVHVLRIDLGGKCRQQSITIPKKDYKPNDLIAVLDEGGAYAYLTNGYRVKSAPEGKQGYSVPIDRFREFEP